MNYKTVLERQIEILEKAQGEISVSNQGGPDNIIQMSRQIQYLVETLIDKEIRLLN